MSDLKAFFAQSAVVESTEELIVSERFVDDKGQPIPWKLRSITEEENTEIRKASTKRVKGRNGSTISEFNQEEYVAKMAAAGVVYPNLKSQELQESYKAIGAEMLLRKMLRPGEYGVLLEKAQEMNGFVTDTKELIDEVKN
ncbi:phage tail assembly chaperone [Paenibacillus pinihumi]|uniref:phage tail assembly chaperone n=1 Tax=Paenibacillus pinihumi TaxID=669462 RepID=UPI0003F9E2F7|nr:phage portal protein [Paenibacillus pinihumi]